MKQTAHPLETVLLLRLVSMFAFPVGVVLAALMERSAFMVVVLAAGMLLVSWVERLRMMRLAGNDVRPDLRGLMPGFLGRFVLLAGLFVVSLGVFALFRETSLARSLSLVDLALFGAATGIALLANTVSSRIAAGEVGGVVSAFRATYGVGGANDRAGDGDVIEGEIIDRD